MKAKTKIETKVLEVNDDLMQPIMSWGNHRQKIQIHEDSISNTSFGYHFLPHYDEKTKSYFIIDPKTKKKSKLMKCLVHTKNESIIGREFITEHDNLWENY